MAETASGNDGAEEPGGDSPAAAGRRPGLLGLGLIYAGFSVIDSCSGPRS